MAPDPWAPAESAASVRPLAGEPVEFDGKAYFEAAFREAVAETATMQAIAWAALVQHLGANTAFQLAPVLLPSLLESASHEALAKTRRAIQDVETKRALREAQQVPTGQPW